MDLVKEEFNKNYQVARSIVTSTDRIISNLEHQRLKKHIRKITRIYSQLYNFVKGPISGRTPLHPEDIIRIATIIEITLKAGKPIETRTKARPLSRATILFRYHLLAFSSFRLHNVRHVITHSVLEEFL